MSAPIADHALLSDCRGSALVDRAGVVSWWCAPRFDSPSAFASLLDPDAGHWTIAPVTPFETERAYRESTLVLETTMTTAGGTLRLTDALVFESGARGHDIGHGSPLALARVAEVLDGQVEVCVELVPRLEYGLVVPRMLHDEHGLTTVGGSERLYLRGDRPLDPGRSRADGRFVLTAGDRAGWILHRAPGLYGDAPEPLDPFAAIEDTTAGWRSWAQQHGGYQGEHAEAVRLAGLVVQALTYQRSGAVVAAATTSLPEVAGGDMNWDYRYGWLRDAALIARALSVSTCSDEARRYVDWMIRAGISCSEAEHVQIAFGVEGERDLAEHELAHLAGHRGASPVRIGNGAWDQKQLDVLGHVLDAAWLVREDLDFGDEITRGFLCELADRACEQWREPDSSIWEGREGERHYLVSKLGCWLALDRAVRLAADLRADPAPWVATRDEIRETILRDGWCEKRGAFTGAFASDRLDAGVLLMALVDFLPADDPRMTATIEALEDELADDDGLLRRWTGAEDGAFLLVTFWLAECHARAGRLERAEQVFAAAAGAANDVGLLSEEVDPASGEALGNLPQAIAHVGLVNAAVALTDARAKAGAR